MMTALAAAKAYAAAQNQAIKPYLTLDGMIRALRWQAHRLAEEAEQGYAGTALQDDRQRTRSESRTMRREEGDDDRSGE